MNLVIKLTLFAGISLFFCTAHAKEISEAQVNRVNSEDDVEMLALGTWFGLKSWPYRTIPYTIASGGGTAWKQTIPQRIATAANYIEKITKLNGYPIIFKKVKKGKNFGYNVLKIIPTNVVDMCKAKIGYQTNIQKQTMTLGIDCKEGTIVHEFGHVLGLSHEQKRWDRDSHLIVRKRYISKKKRDQFKKPKTSLGRLTQRELTPYDLCSIMHYPRMEFAPRCNSQGKNCHTSKYVHKSFEHKNIFIEMMVPKNVSADSRDQNKTLCTADVPSGNRIPRVSINCGRMGQRCGFSLSDITGLIEEYKYKLQAK